MSGKQTRIGYLVASQPDVAAAELRGLFARHKSLAAVAKAEGVDRMTIRRWLATIAAAGQTVRRPKVSGGRPPAKKKARPTIRHRAVE